MKLPDENGKHRVKIKMNRIVTMEANFSGFKLHLITDQFLCYIHMSAALGKVFIIFLYPHTYLSGIIV